MRLRRKRIVNLALQGGGSHGAFTWGVLDRLLEDERLAVEGISGASAGAMNAVVLAHGLTRGGPDEARRALAEFWGRVAEEARSGPLALGQGLVDLLLRRHGLEWSPGLKGYLVLSQMVAPAQLNPLNINPLREIVLSLIDFERLRRDCPIKLFIAATQVRTGKIKVFRNPELSADVVLASACVPSIFPPVEVDGDLYWDGAYTGNPPVFPLLYHCRHRDVIIVLLSPLERPTPPVTASEIRQREAEIMFDAAFLREMHAITRAKERLATRWLTLGRLERTLERKNFHVIAAQDLMASLSPSTKLQTSSDFLTMLRDRGRADAEEWLQAHFATLGARSSVNLGELFG
jgi:NTE family protein